MGAAKKTTEVSTGDVVTTPDGDRTGLVRRTYPGGVMGNRGEVTTVQFQRGSVQPEDAAARPRHWVQDVPNDATWPVVER